MPVIKSAQKRVRQEAKRRARNKEFKNNVKQLTKRVENAIEAKDTKKLNDFLPKLQSMFDRAVKKNQIPANTVQRRMSRLTKLAKEAGANPYDAKKTSTKKKSAAKKSSTKKK
jgi:small subunit ribosomal protein S20